MLIDLSEEELYFLEKMCDTQASSMHPILIKLAEVCMFYNCANDVDAKHKKLLFRQFDEWGMTDILLKGLRNKFENLRLGER